MAKKNKTKKRKKFFLGGQNNMGGLDADYGSFGSSQSPSQYGMNTTGLGADYGQFGQSPQANTYNMGTNVPLENSISGADGSGESGGGLGSINVGNAMGLAGTAVGAFDNSTHQQINPEFNNPYELAKDDLAKQQAYADSYNTSNTWAATKDSLAQSNPIFGLFDSLSKGIGTGMDAIVGTKDDGSHRRITDFAMDPIQGAIASGEDINRHYNTAALGGPINNGVGNGNLTEYKGNGHEQGGIPLGQDTEVEGGETSIDDYVFSDRIMFEPKKKITYADESKRINNRYKKRKGDKYAEEGKLRELEALKVSQEEIRASLGQSDTNTPQGGDNGIQQGLGASEGMLAYGGDIPPAIQGSDNVLTNQVVSENNLWTAYNKAQDEAMLKGDAEKAQYFFKKKQESVGQNPIDLNIKAGNFDEADRLRKLTYNKDYTKKAYGGRIPPYNTDSLNSWNPNATTGNEGRIFIPKSISNDYSAARTRGNEILGEMNKLYPDSTEYTPQQLQQSGFADDYYDSIDYAKNYNKQLGRDFNTAGMDEFGKGINTPLREQMIGDRHRNMFNPKVKTGQSDVSNANESLARSLQTRAYGGPKGGPTGRKAPFKMQGETDYTVADNIASLYDFGTYMPEQYIEQPSTTLVGNTGNPRYTEDTVTTVGGNVTPKYYIQGIDIPKDKEIKSTPSSNKNSTSRGYLSSRAYGGSRKRLAGGGDINWLDYLKGDSPYMQPRSSYDDNFTSMSKNFSAPFTPGELPPRSNVAQTTQYTPNRIMKRETGDAIQRGAMNQIDPNLLDPTTRGLLYGNNQSQTNRNASTQPFNPNQPVSLTNPGMDKNTGLTDSGTGQGDGTTGDKRFEPGMGLGLASSLAGPLYNMIGPGSRPDDVNFDRVNLTPEEISYEEAAREARRSADLNRSYARNAMAQQGASQGQLMSNIGTTGAQIAQQEGAQLANIYEQEENANVLARNEADRINKVSNAQIQMQESIARQQEKDAADSTRGFGISTGGRNVGQYLSDVRKDNVQQDVVKNWMQTDNYDASAIDKGILYTRDKQDSDGKYFRIGKDSNGKLWKKDSKGNWITYQGTDTDNKTYTKKKQDTSFIDNFNLNDTSGLTI